MNLQTYYKPIPERLAQFLLFLNVVIGLIAGSSLLTNHPETAAYVALGAGILNQAVQIFVGQNPAPTHEKSTDSSLSNRRDVVREEKTTRSTPARRKKGGAK